MKQKKLLTYLLAALSFLLLSVVLPACNETDTTGEPVEDTDGGDTDGGDTDGGDDTPDEPTDGGDTDGDDEDEPTDDPTDGLERPELALEEFAVGFETPLYVTHAGDGTDRLFVVGKTGLIYIVEDDEVLDEKFLDISDRIGQVTDGRLGNEQGLLGLAFHPEYETNGRFFVNYTDLAGDTQIVEYSVSDNANVADPASAKPLLSFAQPQDYHNGGHLSFASDGYLYINTGDGGTPDAAQDTGSLLGKILRIDVDNGDPYAIPEDNPFVSEAGARGEVWVYGLRNPWRSSFDRETGDLYIADVGQDEREEVSFQAGNSTGGENYGWPITEGDICWRAETCDTDGLSEPIIVYDHDAGVSITGGYVYRGDALPGLVGDYFYADFAARKVWVASREGDGWTSDLLFEDTDVIASFGEDEAGELYAVGLGGGKIFKIVAAE